MFATYSPSVRYMETTLNDIPIGEIFEGSIVGTYGPISGIFLRLDPKYHNDLTAICLTAGSQMRGNEKNFAALAGCRPVTNYRKVKSLKLDVEF